MILVRSHNMATLIADVKEVTPKTSTVYSDSGIGEISLKGGFTTCFWVYLEKLTPDQHSSILYQWRNASEYDFVCGIRKGAVYLEIANEEGEIKKVISERKLSKHKWHSIVVRFEIDDSGYSDASLIVNSYFDSSVVVNDYLPFSFINVTVGKFKSLKSYKGAIAQLFVFFYPLSDNEIREHYKDGLEELQNGNGNFIQKVISKDENDFNRQKYATQKHIPDDVLRQTNPEPDLFKTVNSDDEAMNERAEEGMMTETQMDENSNNIAAEEIDYYIFEHPLISDQLVKIANNYNWILSVSSVMATGDITKDGALELSRFMKVLKFLKIKIGKNIILEIAQIAKAATEYIDEQDDKVRHPAIMYYNFLKALKLAIHGDMLDLNDDNFERVSVGDFSDSDDHIEYEPTEPEESEKEPSEQAIAVGRHKDSFHSSPGKIPKVRRLKNDDYDESEDEEKEVDKTLPPVLGPEAKVPEQAVTVLLDKSVNEEGLIKNFAQDEEMNKAYQEKLAALEEPEVEEPQEEPIEMIENTSLPELEDGWHSGEFEVNIIRCSDCYKHFHYCRHSEDEYVNEFNRVGNDISDKFPEATIIGNHEKASYMGCFDIYLRGVGPVDKRDSQGRYFIFRKNVAERFPTAKEVQDSIIMLALLYGSSKKLGQAQNDFKKQYDYLIPKPIAEMHDHPADAPEILMKQPDLKNKSKPQQDRLMTCKNWGCGKDYHEDKNEKYSCMHHPGVYQFGSRHGLWPESWTCCRAEWEAMGCRRGYHRGVPKDEFVRLCINHGEPNPDSTYPDSFCGKPFKEPVKKPEWQQTQEDKDALIQCKIHPGYVKRDKKLGIAEWTC